MEMDFKEYLKSYSPESNTMQENFYDFHVLYAMSLSKEAKKTELKNKINDCSSKIIIWWRKHIALFIPNVFKEKFDELIGKNIRSKDELEYILGNRDITIIRSGEKHDSITMVSIYKKIFSRYSMDWNALALTWLQLQHANTLPKAAELLKKMFTMYETNRELDFFDRIDIFKEWVRVDSEVLRTIKTISGFNSYVSKYVSGIIKEYTNTTTELIDINDLIQHLLWNRRKPTPNEMSIIANSPKYSYLYAYYVLKAPFPEGEPEIARSPEYSYLYAKNVLKGPFQKGEKIISTSGYYSMLYAIGPLKGQRFKAGEPEIMKDENLKKIYNSGVK